MAHTFDSDDMILAAGACIRNDGLPYQVMELCGDFSFDTQVKDTLAREVALASYWTGMQEMVSRLSRLEHHIDFMIRGGKMVWINRITQSAGTGRRKL